MFDKIKIKLESKWLNFNLIFFWNLLLDLEKRFFKFLILSLNYVQTNYVKNIFKIINGIFIFNKWIFKRLYGDQDFDDIKMKLKKKSVKKIKNILRNNENNSDEPVDNYILIKNIILFTWFFNKKIINPSFFLNEYEKLSNGKFFVFNCLIFFVIISVNLVIIFLKLILINLGFFIVILLSIYFPLALINLTILFVIISVLICCVLYSLINIFLIIFYSCFIFILDFIILLFLLFLMLTIFTYPIRLFILCIASIIMKIRFTGLYC